MHGAIVTGEITDEALDDLRCETVTLEKTVDIKQVARMLAILVVDEAHHGFFGAGAETRR